MRAGPGGSGRLYCEENALGWGLLGQTLAKQAPGSLAPSEPRLRAQLPRSPVGRDRVPVSPRVAWCCALPRVGVPRRKNSFVNSARSKPALGPR